MTELQKQYLEKYYSIITMKTSTTVKNKLLQSLIVDLRQINEPHHVTDTLKNKQNMEIMSTAFSETPSNSIFFEKEVEQLEQKIIKLRLSKFENNEDIEICEEEHYQIERISRTRSEYNDYLKKKIDLSIEAVNHGSGQKQKGEKEKDKDKDRSVLNKSLDAVAGVLKFSKWWG